MVWYFWERLFAYLYICSISPHFLKSHQSICCRYQNLPFAFHYLRYDLISHKYQFYLFIFSYLLKRDSNLQLTIRELVNHNKKIKKKLLLSTSKYLLCTLNFLYVEKKYPYEDYIVRFLECQ